MRTRWEEYRHEIIKEIPDYEGDGPVLFSIGLVDEWGKLIGLYKREILTGTVKIETHHEIINNLFWYVAALEKTYNLPPSLNSGFIGHKVTLNNPSGELNELVVFQDVLEDLVSFMDQIQSGTLADIQFNLNLILDKICLYCGLYSIDTKNCLINSKSPDAPQKKRKKKNSLDKILYPPVDLENMLVINIILDGEQYGGLQLNTKQGVIHFQYGDFITDYFYTVLNISTQLGYKEYVHSKELQEFLFKQPVALATLKEDTLTLVPRLDAKHTIVNPIKLKNNNLLLVITEDLDNLNALLDHTNKYTNGK